ncbi:MAG: hypothetical protein HYV07_25200 [Deltaproteobacteria bacterium]|nr:hypothetical protein [Deltaproteobacteria bacterium]
MDPELKALLVALVEGQTKLAESQARSHAQTQQSLRETQETIRELARRMDAYAEAVVRGLTASVERDGTLGARFDDHERRILALENAPRSPPAAKSRKKAERSPRRRV